MCRLSTRFDEAQLRFNKGSKLDDNFYVRQDGTCAYYFDKDELENMICSLTNDSDSTGCCELMIMISYLHCQHN